MYGVSMARSVTFDAAGKSFPNGTVAVQSLTLEIAAGEVLALVGPSGCGKSTSLRMINRLVEPTSGKVLLGGEDTSALDAVQLRRDIGYVIQHVGLFPHRTVAANIATVPVLLGWEKSQVKERTTELLELIGLGAEYASRYPHELSGGEKQRVGVARALAARPPVLLMDEPFGAVDPQGRRRLQHEFAALQKELGTTVVLVTHDLREAAALADRIAVLSKGAHLEQVGTPQQVLHAPANDVVADFVADFS